MGRRMRRRLLAAVFACSLLAALTSAGCMLLLPIGWDAKRDVTDEAKYWGGYSPGETYRLKADVLLNRTPNRRADGVFTVPAGVAIRIEKFVQHTGHSPSVDVVGTMLDGPQPGRRVQMRTLSLPDRVDGLLYPDPEKMELTVREP